MYVYIYILKRHYKEMKRTVLHKRVMLQIYENLKIPYVSI